MVTSRIGRPSSKLKRVVYQLLATEENGLSAGAVRTQLIDLATKEGATEAEIEKLPPIRTITRWKGDYTALAEQEKAHLRAVRWPDTLVAGVLPWEASRVLLDLLSVYEDFSLRPSPVVARWAWRTFLGAPDLEPLTRWRVAIAAALHETYEALPGGWPSIEAWLADRAWTADGAERYERGIVEGLHPPFDPWQLVLPKSMPGEQMAEAYGDWLGVTLPAQAERMLAVQRAALDERHPTAEFYRFTMTPGGTMKRQGETHDGA